MPPNLRLTRCASVTYPSQKPHTAAISIAHTANRTVMVPQRLPPARAPTAARRGVSRRNSGLLEQRPNVGLAAAEAHECLHRIQTPAARENGIEKAGGGGAIEHAGLLERIKGVGGEHFGPFIAVVACGVSAGKNVGETRRHAIERRCRYNRHSLPYAIERFRNPRAGGRIEVRMQFEIEAGQLDLPQRIEGR